MKTIVVSAVNLRKGGTLTILRSCLNYLSSLQEKEHYRVIALVHKKELVYYQGIEYIELSWTVKSWLHRLWCEYVTMYRLSKKLSPVFLWLSLHDTTPRVKAYRRAVYCQTSFPFYRWSFKDFVFDYKIPLFSLFTKYAYLVNIKKNNYLIVQQEWLRSAFSKMFRLHPQKFIVAPPQREIEEIPPTLKKMPYYIFFYPATPDCHKNFEFVCQAAALLEKEIGVDKFKVIITINGTENRYAHWLYKKWRCVSSIDFVGFMNRRHLGETYAVADCLVFPSKIETWGLPISEFMPTRKAMLLADLPYARETSAGSQHTAFFPLSDFHVLKDMMKRLIDGNDSILQKVRENTLTAPYARSWEELLSILLNNA